MSLVSLDKQVRTWFALRRLDENDERAATLRQVSIPAAAEVAVITEILTDTFGLNSSSVILKIRNHHGRLIPLNSSLPANSEHTPHVLDATRSFQHVRPKPRAVPGTKRSVQSRLQAVGRRIQRLNNLLPQIKRRYNEKLMQDIECLEQKLKFLHRRMQAADSHIWTGMLTRAPLW